MTVMLGLFLAEDDDPPYASDKDYRFWAWVDTNISTQPTEGWYVFAHPDLNKLMESLVVETVAEVDKGGHANDWAYTHTHVVPYHFVTHQPPSVVVEP